MASGRKFGWKHAAAALGGGFAGAGMLMGLGKLGAPPVITSAVAGGMGLIGVGITRGPVQMAIGSALGAGNAVLLGSLLTKGRVKAERDERAEKVARGEMSAAEAKRVDDLKGARRNNEITAATVEAFDRLRAELAIDDEERAAA